LGDNPPDKLVPLPLLKGYPITVNVNEALNSVKKTLSDVGVMKRRKEKSCRSKCGD
jgi:hypothetical protein